MTEETVIVFPKSPNLHQALSKKRLRRRKFAEMRFRIYGMIAIGIGIALVITVFTSIAVNGVGAFQQTQIKLNVILDEEEFTGNSLSEVNYLKLVKNSIYREFPDVTKRRDKSKLYKIVSSSSDVLLANIVKNDPSLIGQTVELWFPVDDIFDVYNKQFIDDSSKRLPGKISDKQVEWFKELKGRGTIDMRFNKLFFTRGDSREPELAGILSALIGSMFMIGVTLILSFPIGVAAACYLEEFAPRNRFTDVIEININNLAAVPSVVFGLLGLAIFINFFGLPRSVPFVGGLVLTLMTIPTIIIASRAALRAVPPSIREGAYALGASKPQVVLQSVLPLAMPGMLTGTIIGLAQALGETAPLLMIGMVAFIVDIPSGPFDPSTALPVQIFLWADSPERAFQEKTAGAILVLLTFLISVNILAVILRKRFERRW